MADRAGDYIVGLFGAEDELLASLREEADRNFDGRMDELTIARACRQSPSRRTKGVCCRSC